ncbi:MAG: TonB-dependent receptor [Betaproteobacteria bacterium]|nr:TonB-dependent receptor [Betaproteobacteria bacterium]
MTLKNDAISSVLALALLFSAGAKADENDEKQTNDERQTEEEVSQKTGKSAESNVFRLGQITVTGQREDEPAIATSTLSNEEIRDFSKESLKEALDIVPGVAVTTGTGSRNEAGISIRGFNRYQVPLYMDGVRLYLPVDGRTDMDRFLTMDLAEIQVSKGYVSVLNGPDGMGGAINLVTRKPVKSLEGELSVSAKLGESGQYGGYTGYANLGSKQDQYYWQVSVEQRDLDNWRLSRDFVPTVAQGAGERENTGKKDWRTNLKAGFTPNATDEYSLNFVMQEGEKHGVGAVTGTSAISTWDWPKWNTWSLYWLSHTQLGEKNYVKTKVYFNNFTNDLLAYTNTTLSTRNWLSHYDDNAQGVSVEFGTTALPRQTLKTALHFRRDQHKEWQDLNLATANPFTEPKQETLEDGYSFALEDTVHVAPKFDLVGGVSRDIRRTKKAQDYTPATGLFNYEIADQFATNWQGAAIYRYREGGKASFSVSKRYRFPTMFDRFSSRFGSAMSNPFLKPEHGLNIELGISDRIHPGLYVEGAIFYNRLKDAINWANGFVDPADGLIKQKAVNLGEATYRGFELGSHAQVMPNLELGGNYTYIDTKVNDPNIPDYRLTSTPRHKAFLYAKWKPVNDLKIIPSIEYGGMRWSDPPSGSGYVRMGDFTLFNLKVEYQLNRNWDISLAARNLLDKNYEVTSGYPEEGRSFLLSTRFQF